MRSLKAVATVILDRRRRANFAGGYGGLLLLNPRKGTTLGSKTAVDLANVG